MIKIAITEDIAKIAETLKDKIELSTDFKVVKTMNNGQEFVQWLSNDPDVDVIFMDINMPVMNGIEATREAIKIKPEIKIIISSIMDDEYHLFEAMISGAVGYLLKDETPAKVHRAIYEAIEGGMPMNATIARIAMQQFKGKMESKPLLPAETYSLTEREMDVLYLLSTGLTYEQIGERLFISYGTVRKHVENIYRKMGVTNRMNAVMKARGKFNT
jgi:DNA-binding NarL/FixJ family response regulator